MLSDVKNALLAEYNLQQQIGFCDEIIDGYSGFVFQNRFGSLLSSNDINRALERIYTACNNEERERAKEEKRPPVLIRHFSDREDLTAVFRWNFRILKDVKRF